MAFAFSLAGLYVCIVIALLSSLCFGAIWNMCASVAAAARQVCGSLSRAITSNFLGSSQTNISLSSAASIEFVLTPPADTPSIESVTNANVAPSGGLTVPSMAMMNTPHAMPSPPQTPVLVGQIGGSEIPTISLDADLAPSSGLTVPSMATMDTANAMLSPPQTPVLVGQTGGNETPSLNLDDEAATGSGEEADILSTVSRVSSPLITSSPYTQNEGLTFPSGTSLWQPASSATGSRPIQGPASLITSSPYSQNEGLTFPLATALWTQKATAAALESTQGLWTQRTSPVRQPKDLSTTSPLSQRPMAAPLSSSNLVTASPYTQNEGLTFAPGTSLWKADAATTGANRTGKTSLITSSPYEQNEGLTFAPGTSFWQPKTVASTEQEAGTPDLPTPPSSQTVTPTEKKDAPGLWTPPSSQTVTPAKKDTPGLWTPPTSTPTPLPTLWEVAAQARLPKSKTTTSPYDHNESLTFAAGTALWSK